MSYKGAVRVQECTAWSALLVLLVACMRPTCEVLRDYGIAGRLRRANQSFSCHFSSFSFFLFLSRLASAYLRVSCQKGPREEHAEEGLGAVLGSPLKVAW